MRDADDNIAKIFKFFKKYFFCLEGGNRFNSGQLHHTKSA
jgi:hypothetical protein